MPKSAFPFAVRLIGFKHHEAGVIEKIFAKHAEQGYGYFSLPLDNLQDPDLFLVNADDDKAMLALTYLRPSSLRPALMVSSDRNDSENHWMMRPVRAADLLQALNHLVEKRADALSHLEASDVVTVPERRRRDRLAGEGGQPSDFLHLRRPPINGGVLVIDKNLEFKHHIAEMLAPRRLNVDYAADEEVAISRCQRQKISVVLVNTSTPGIEPYRLCKRIKTEVAERVTVVFLVGKSFPYDAEKARDAGCDGYLIKPIPNRHLMSAFKKFLPTFWR